MAFLFWTRTDYCMMSSLVAAHMCDELQEIAGDEPTIVSSLDDTATKLRKSMLMVLNECSASNHEKAKDLVEFIHDQHFNGLRISDVVLADASMENLDIVSHDAVQEKITKTPWTGDLEDKTISLWYLLVCWILFPLILRLPFKQERIKQENANLEKKMTFLRKLRSFYTKTPAVKFVSHTVGYIVFLAFLSHGVMTKPTTQLIWLDYLLIVTVAGYIITEVDQVIRSEGPNFFYKIKQWGRCITNITDIFAMSLYFVALILRLHTETTHVGHLIYAIDACFWWLRLLPMMMIDPVLGPYLVMIKKMIRDLVSVITNLKSSLRFYQSTVSKHAH